MLDKLRKGIDFTLLAISVGLFVFMILVGTYQIAARYFFKSPSTVSEELLTYSFAWMALFASSYAFGKQEHMRMGFLADKLSEESRYWVRIAAEVLVLLFAAAVQLYGGIRIIRLTMSQTTASLGIPMGIVYLAVPLSGFLTVVYAVLNLLTLFRQRKKEETKGGDAR